jgi:uncharacterized protein (AIM24 family)
MSSLPIPIPTTYQDETCAGVRYHLSGALVPVLMVELNQTRIYFEHHILLWKDPAVAITASAVGGAFKRMLSGLPIFLTEASGPGRIAFSRDGAGQIMPIHLQPGQGIDVREHQFVAATQGVAYTFQRMRGIANMLFGGTGFFIDHFSCSSEPGVIWLHGYGNVSVIDLAPGERIDVEPGAWVFKDPTVQIESTIQRLSTGFFASPGQVVWNRFTGPGRLGIQSMSLFLPSDQ